MSATVSTGPAPGQGIRGGLEDAGGADWMEALLCPQCGERLQRESAQLTCMLCGGHSPVIDGVPWFVSEFPYWGEIPQKEMQEVNRAAAADSWKSALLNSPSPVVRKAAEMMLNLDRANWQWLVDLPPDSLALDVGAGTGTVSHALATHYREVFATEPVLERVCFMRQRFTQEGLDNVRLLRTSLWSLPFPPEHFDLVAMNGVLEWVAEGRAGKPGELQRAALSKIFRLLKPGGYLYLGIENRFTPGYFVGHPDPHCGLPFVTVLPRRLADWYARRKGLPGYRNHLYSSRGYRKLLQGTGFRSVEVYLALPSYNHPRFLVPLDPQAHSYYSRNFNSVHTRRLHAMLHELMLRLGLLRHCEYSFAILARK
jgi:SAM-dependent methyltransferase